jgi:hypothetical protein
MGWTDSPQYLKGIQKIRAMSPEDKAVTQTLVNELHGLYADQDMRKQLGAMKQATMNKRMDRDVALGERRLGMKQDAYDFEKDQSKTAENLGWGNMALSGLAGFADMQNRKKHAKNIEGLAKDVYGRK